MSTTCGHSSTYVDCSRAAENAGFVRPSPEERTLAMAKTGRLARGAYLSKEDAADNEYSFPNRWCCREITSPSSQKSRASLLRTGSRWKPPSSEMG
ncbi:hypothetical protein V3481_009257 [Fusarium oxysporum f. sp. vasinfectum]|uniref:Uncharacterized protein n=1 Tax=Fusarium oxysporum f. sp. vasinfectum 25433 TaxID=1089449 RepID=X0M9C4_FUSOX|nr:hypothetical protein FOTG_04999 [Fusarium oxysporum f. sp. vasinfectum 25433]